MKPLTVLPIPSVCRNLAECFETCVQQHPEKEAFIFLEVSTSAECMILTYIQPREKALAIAITLQAKRACGERVLLIYKPGLEFIAAFLGCIYAGAIAVPACPPRKNHHFERLQGILHNAQAKLVLTTFHVEEGRPIQRIHSERSLQLSVLHRDAGFPSAEEIQFLVSQLSAPRFNLETDLLLRAQLVQWQNRQSALILVIHHIISDAWSVGVLIQELLTLYPRLCVGQLIDLPALPIQYSDFAVWHRQTIAAGLEPNLVYWRSKLAHAPQELTLPTDAPRPAQPTFRGRTYHQKFESSLGTALKTLSKQAGVTLFMTLMGAYSLLLSRYSGQSDLLIGSTFAARQQTQVQPLIGLFLNTLVFRIDTSGNPTVQELLTQVKQVALEAFAHPEIPFEELSAHLPSAERRNSWFQAMFILQTIPRPALSVPDLSLTLVPVSGVGAKCDLALWMEDSSDGLRAEWEYNCDLFEFTTIERSAAQFNQLLVHLVQDLQRSIAQLPVLSPRELQWLESFVSRPSTTPEPLQPVHQWIEAQAARTPAAIALESQGKTWTYQTLNEKANQIAQVLRSKGITSNTLVGVCLEHSPDLIATLLGILKAGATYVPMDSTYPSERLHQMLEDAQVEVLVTRSDLQIRLRLTAPVVLDLNDPLGIADDFFELGGHSLLAMQLLSRVQKHFQVQVQLHPLFEDPTIAQLADLILAAQLQQTDPDLLEQLLAELEELPDEVAL